MRRIDRLHLALLAVIALLLAGLPVTAYAARAAAPTATVACDPATLAADGSSFDLHCRLATPTPAPSPSPSSSPTPTAPPTSAPPSPTPTASPTPTGDRTPPSAPTGLTSTPRSPTSLLITWTASTDNVAVTGYQFFRGDTNLGTTPTPDWLDTNLTPDTAYTYRARAVDAAGNLSAFSATFTARTPANPAPTPGNQCQQNPGGCGFPDAASTGAAAGLPTSTRTQFTTAGETVTNVRLAGCVEVRAPNVTFRNVDFAPNTGCFWRIRNYSTSLMVIDSTISCGGSNNNGFANSDVTMLRVEITACENGLGVGAAGRVTVTDSWIHDLVTANGAHTDGAQFDEGASSILFQHNTIIMPTPGSTSAIIMWDEGGVQNANVTIAGNLLAGGTYTLYCGRQGVAVNVQIVNNRFGTFEYKYADACNAGGEVWTGNVRDSDGALIPAA